MLRASVIVFLIFAGARTSQGCERRDSLPVKLFNDAAVEDRVLRQATQEAAWLLKSVCMAVEWTPCPVVTALHQEPCGNPAPAVEMHILPSPATDDFADGVLGIGFPGLGSWGHSAVFLSRVRQLVLTNTGVIDLSDMMGVVLAHEIGHLLLHSSAHSAEGIMRADFRPVDLKRAAQRQLKFTPAQADAIRLNVLAANREPRD